MIDGTYINLEHPLLAILDKNRLLKICQNIQKEIYRVGTGFHDQTLAIKSQKNSQKSALLTKLFKLKKLFIYFYKDRS